MSYTSYFEYIDRLLRELSNYVNWFIDCGIHSILGYRALLYSKHCPYKIGPTKCEYTKYTQNSEATWNIKSPQCHLLI